MFTGFQTHPCPRSCGYKEQKLLSGILYLHRITDNRVVDTPLKNLRAFRKLCGRDVLGKIYLTTTMWDEVDQSLGERMLDELKTDYWKAVIIQEAQIIRCRNDDDSPKSIKSLERRPLVKYSQLDKLDEKQMLLPRRIDEERKVLENLLRFGKNLLRRTVNIEVIGVETRYGGRSVRAGGRVPWLAGTVRQGRYK